MFSISTIYFVVTGIQFWITDYMIEVLGADKNRVIMVFALSSLTAPILGVIFGGKISDSLGGYAGRHALAYCTVNTALAAFFGLIIPFINSVVIVSFLLWIVFFFGGATLPTLTGLMISSVPKPLRNVANSVA